VEKDYYKVRFLFWMSMRPEWIYAEAGYFPGITGWEEN
jgi:hypothetical protein